MIVDQNLEFAQKLSSHLEGTGFITHKAKDGKEAYREILLKDYEYLLVNFYISGYSAFSLIRFLLQTHKETKVVLIFDNRSLFESGEVATSDFRSLSVEHFLIKNQHPLEAIGAILYQLMEPTKKIELIQKNISNLASIGNENDNFTFVKIPIAAFIPPATNLFNVYLILSSGRSILVLRKGELLNIEIIQKLQAKGLKEVAVRNYELVDYLFLSLYILKSMDLENDINRMTFVCICEVVLDIFAKSDIALNSSQLADVAFNDFQSSIFNSAERFYANLLEGFSRPETQNSFSLSIFLCQMSCFLIVDLSVSAEELDSFFRFIIDLYNNETNLVEIGSNMGLLCHAHLRIIESSRDLEKGEHIKTWIFVFLYLMKKRTFIQATSWVEFLLEFQKILPPQYTQLRQMLDSPKKASFTLINA